MVHAFTTKFKGKGEVGWSGGGGELVACKWVSVLAAEPKNLISTPRFYLAEGEN